MKNLLALCLILGAKCDHLVAVWSPELCALVCSCDPRLHKAFCTSDHLPGTNHTAPSQWALHWRWGNQSVIWHYYFAWGVWGSRWAEMQRKKQLVLLTGGRDEETVLTTSSLGLIIVTLQSDGSHLKEEKRREYVITSNLPWLTWDNKPG